MKMVSLSLGFDRILYYEMKLVFNILLYLYLVAKDQSTLPDMMREVSFKTLSKRK